MKYNRPFARNQWKNSFPAQNIPAWRSGRQRGREYSFRNFTLSNNPAPSSQPPIVEVEA
jgi:hypothetical protein